MRAPLSGFARRTLPQPASGCLAVLAFVVAVLLAVAAGLLLVWVHNGRASPELRAAEPRALIILLVALLACLVEAVWQRSRAVAACAPCYDRNDADFAAARSLEAAMPALLQRAGSADPALPGVRVFQRMQLGEVLRQVDLAASNGSEEWLERQLRRAVPEAPRARLAAAAADRDSTPGDGFFAILEDRAAGGIDTVRVVVPPERRMRREVGRYLAALGTGIGADTHRGAVLIQSAAMLQRELWTDGAYVSDRLVAMARHPEPDAPTVTVLGAELQPHVLLGGAVQFGEEERIHQLFPIGLVLGLTRLATIDPPAGAPDQDA